MSKRRPKLHPGMVQLTLPLSSLPSQERKAGSLRTSDGVKEALRIALKGCGLSRETVADELTRLTGHNVSIHTLNNWAAPSTGDRPMPLDMLAALSVVTGDHRIAQAALECAGLKVLTADEAPLFELGRMVAEDRERTRMKREIFQKIKG